MMKEEEQAYIQLVILPPQPVKQQMPIHLLSFISPSLSSSSSKTFPGEAEVAQNIPAASQAPDR